MQARLRRVAIGEVGISAIVLAELRFGVEKSRRRDENAAALADFLAFCLVLDWSHQAAGPYVRIRNDLEAQGMPIGANDLLIAAHAMHLGCVLVTNNVQEFRRVDGLDVDNWI